MTLRLTPHDLESAARVLQAGGTVAFPTETVYGLGADATKPAAIVKIFQAKERPADNPLIIHLYSFEQLDRYCSAVSDVADKFLKAFCPGPLTLVLPKRAVITDLATAGLNSVAVRFPAHPTARELLRLANLPIAAPSANRSGRPSATTFEAVVDDLDGRITAVVCDEPSPIGLESTVVDMTGEIPIVLRAGGVSLEALQAIEPTTIMRTQAVDSSVNSPGLRHRHYQPLARVVLCRSLRDVSIDSPKSSAFIGLEATGDKKFGLSLRCETVDDYARLLFDFFRRCDTEKIDTIYCQTVEEAGIGYAINDRLRRAGEA